MPQRCTVCDHATRGEIDRQLAEGASTFRMARLHGLSEPALRRHGRNHLPRELARAVEAERATEAGATLARVERLAGDLEAMAADARSTGDCDTFLRVARELRGSLELLGRVRGELSSGTTINVLVAQLGVTLDVARNAVRMVQTVEAMSEKEQIAEATAFLADRGWKCMPA